MIRRNLKIKPRGSETPEELEKMARLSDDELHGAYEKASMTGDSGSEMGWQEV